MADENKNKEEVMEVPKSLIESILKKQEDMEKRLDEKDQIIDKLTYAADKGRMGIYEQRNAKGELIRTFGVGFWPVSDKKSGETTEYLVRGTKMIFQDVAIEDNGGVRRLVENQLLRVYLDQGVNATTGKENDYKEIDVPYVNFYRTVKRKRFPLVKESRDENGEYRTLRLEDGREVEFDINFLNY